jgi:TPR repeat protein
LGDCYLKGEGVEQNEEKALHWYEEAANNQNVKAMYKAGECYYNGIGTKPDHEKAYQWWSLASKHGLQEAKEKLDKFIF